MKKTAILMVLALCSIRVYSQTYQFQYQYDAKGNRNIKTLICVSCRVGVDDTIQPLKERLDNYRISIYPNPVLQTLQMEVNRADTTHNYSWTIQDIGGKLMENGSAVVNNTDRIDFSTYPTGMYLLEMVIDKKKKEYKIIKE